MTKELRRLSILVLAMFLALFASTTVIQGIEAENLAENPKNTRTKYDSYEIQRGAIIASGSAIASSVPTSDVYSFQRTYADPGIWAPVTGYFNPILGSATGLERALNTELSGVRNENLFSRIDQVISGQPPRGASVEVSIRADVQKAAYEAMGDNKGAIVAIEPKTGRILAMVSTPGFDTNSIATHDTAAANAAHKALDDDAAKPLINRAITGDMNPPGSTFKVVVAAAALESGKYTATSKLPNPASYTLPQTSNTVHNASGGACGDGGNTVTIADALKYSCNIPMAELAVELGDDAIRETAEKFGFNKEFDIPLSVSPSQYPTGLDAPNTALSGFGQGKVLATPLEMAMVSAGIANGGAVMKPTMVDDVLAADLSVIHHTEPSELSRAVSDKVADSLTEMMVTNVRDGVAGNARMDGVDVAGKTGTAENGSRPYSLWFTGFAPANDPEVAVAVVVEDGGGQGTSGSGDEIAAPVAKKVMEAVLNK